MAERMIPVPESLVERIDYLLGAGRDLADRRAVQAELRTLLSQPTPAAESELIYTTMPVLPAAPPSIPDMAPGTTFTEAVDWTVFNDTYARCEVDGGVAWRSLRSIDPSTIRDVRAPDHG